MNITLRCRGSKREQAKPPSCAARRRPRRRAGCRGDRTKAALNAPGRPNRPHCYSAATLVLDDLCQAGAAPPRRATGAFLLSVVGESGFQVEQVRRGQVEGVRAVVTRRRPVSQPVSPAPCSVRRRTLARHRHRTSSRSRISVARSALSASVSRQAQPSRPPKSSRPR
jgi:hypothetical protein